MGSLFIQVQPWSSEWARTRYGHPELGAHEASGMGRAPCCASQKWMSGGLSIISGGIQGLLP